MPDMVIRELGSLDREALMVKMTRELPSISGKMGTTPLGIIERTGLDRERMGLVVSGKRKMKWSEYLSILFVLWDDEKGQELVEERGLFPEVLRRAMSVNRNAHI